MLFFSMKKSRLIGIRLRLIRVDYVLSAGTLYVIQLDIELPREPVGIGLFLKLGHSECPTRTLCSYTFREVRDGTSTKLSFAKDFAAK